MRKEILALSVLATVIAQPALAAALKGDLDITADRLEKEENVVSAQGRVVATYENYVLFSELLRYDLEKKRGHAEGKVKLTSDGSFFEAESLDFDLVEKKAEANFFKGTLAEEGRFEGKKIILAPTLLEAREAKFIPCLTAEPYSIEGKKITYFPGLEENNLVLDQAAFFLGKNRIFTLPTTAVTVGKARERQLLSQLQPRAGFNAYEGLFAQGQMSYRLNQNSFGSIPFKYSVNRGLFAGLDHTYSLGRDDEILGNASYQNPWIEGQGGIRSNLTARHRFDGGGNLELVSGYRSEINSQAISRLELSSLSPPLQVFGFNLNARGSVGSLYEEALNVGTNRASFRADWYRPLGFAGIALYGWDIASLYSQNHQLSSLLGARIDQEKSIFSLFLGGEGLRINGVAPLLSDRMLQSNRLYGGAGVWVGPNWRLAMDSSFVNLLPTGTFAPENRWSQNDLGMGVEFRTQCLSWQLRFQPLILGLRFDYQLSKF